MAIKLMYITNNPTVAEIAFRNGTDRIFIDLEVKGKAERQAGKDTVLSNHSVEDIYAIREAVPMAEILVRANPIHEKSEEELSKIVNSPCDIIMLPFFKTAEEVKSFMRFTGGKKKTCLLFETPTALENAEEILNIEGIDEVYIGLNDLHLCCGMNFMFEPLANGTVESFSKLFKAKGKPFGFGGIARFGKGVLSAKMVLGEHYRLGSDRIILSRSFCNTDKVRSNEEIERIFSEGIGEIREYESFLKNADSSFFEANRTEITKDVEQIVKAKRGCGNG